MTLILKGAGVETPVATVYAPGWNCISQRWEAEILVFDGAYNDSIGNITAYGPSFSQAIANILRVLDLYGYSGTLAFTGPGNEDYCLADMSGDKPKLRCNRQVDWSGLFAGHYNG